MNSNYILSQAKKRAYIIRLGCHCKKCNMGLLEKPYCADFHHNISHSKEYNPSDLSTHNFSKSLNEIDKCTLLCTNCHREIHFNMDKFNLHKKAIRLKEREVSSEQINHSKKDENITKEVLILHSQGKHIKTIAKELGISRTPVKRILLEQGLEPHSWEASTKISQDQITSLLEMGITNKREIAKRLKCSYATVHNMFTRFNLR
jgi:transposase